MTTTPHGATELVSGQAVPETTVNQQIRHTEAGACHFVVTDNDLTAPPGSCADGACYIIAATATGIWTGKENQVAIALGTNAASGWAYQVPKEGYTAYIQDEDVRHIFGGATWAVDTSGGVSLNLSTTVAQSGTPVPTSVGFLGSPQISTQTTHTLALVDSGGHYYHVSGSAHTLTIPANGSVAFPIGTIIGIVNESGGGVVSVAITTDTLRWGSSTGTRSIAANGSATLLKVTATVWRLTGDGIT